MTAAIVSYKTINDLMYLVIVDFLTPKTEETQSDALILPCHKENIYRR